MLVDKITVPELSIGFRRKGRPRIASDAVQANNYKDDNNQYAMVAGLKPWHERVVDAMIANPTFKVVNLAEVFSVTPQWMGSLLRTDAFKQYYSERMLQHRKMIDATVVNKLAGIAEKALDAMSNKLDTADLTFGQAKEAADVALRGLGYLGQGGNAGTTLNVNMPGSNPRPTQVFVGQDLIDAARKKLIEHQATAQVESHPNAYQQVTSALDRPAPDRGVEDAVILGPDE